MVYEYISSQNDKNMLNDITNKVFNIKTFDYEGIKYRSSEAQNLIPEIESSQNKIIDNIKVNDIKIYKYFYNKSLKIAILPYLKKNISTFSNWIQNIITKQIYIIEFRRLQIL